MNTLPMVFKMLLTRRPAKWPKWVEFPRQPKPPQRVEGSALRLTFINHATVLIQSAGLNILSDPQYSLRCSPVSFAGPKRAHAPGVAFEELPPIDLVLLSHNHYDHMDMPSLRRLLKEHPCSIATGLEMRRYFKGVDPARILELDWWQGIQFKGLTLHFVPVRHFSARSFHDRFETLWGGFVLEAPYGKIYFPGDTAYGKHFAMTAERLGKMKMAILPIGAYEPRWFMGSVHVNPQEAVQAFQDLGAELALGVHFGCFQLTEEPIDEPLKALARALAAAGIAPERFQTLQPGAAWQLD
jgi:L-ascorbate metabolism protein UlaG (beta-lactamase superfamily)